MRRWLVQVVAACSMLAVLSSANATTNADVEAQNADLKTELRAMRAEIERLHKRLDAIERRVGGDSPDAAPGATAPSRTASGGSSNQPPSTEAPGSPPPGVIPPGVPIPPASGAAPGDATVPPGQAAGIGSAVKKLMPGALSGPTSLPPGYANQPGPYSRGVIVPGIEGVPKVFIPDIGAVGDLTLRQSDIRSGDARYNPADDKFRPRDTQLILFAPIDPYTNAQISFDKPDNAPFALEEAFLVFNKLPYDLTLRAGQFRPRFGLLNQFDTFQLPMVNRPQALTRYLGDDGLIEPGVNLTGYLPNPWGFDLRADFNIVSGLNPVSFDHRDGRNFDFAYIGSLVYSRELFSTGSLSTGVSLAGGPGPGGATYLGDPFLQIQYAPSQRQIWTWSIESLLVERKGVGDHGLKRGLYTLLDHNFALRWHAGLLLDISDVPYLARGTELGFSPILTYFVSDNTRLRLQYTHTTGSRARGGPERASNAVFMQATFSLGNLKPLD